MIHKIINLKCLLIIKDINLNSYLCAKKAGKYIGVKYIEDYIRKYNLTNEQF